MPLALVRGLRINYLRLGRAGAGTPLVMLHGWANSSQTLQPLAEALAAKYDVIVPDLPGFGRSQLPKEPAGWDHADYAAATAELLAKLKLDRAIFFGHSRGGAIAAYLAVTRPECVERLVLCASAGLRERLPLVVRARRRYRRTLLQLTHRAANAGLLGKHGVERAQRLSERYASRDYRAAGQLRPTLARLLGEDLEPLLPRIAAPTLLIWGERDDETPLELGRRSARLISGSRLFVVPSAGHHVFAEQPAAVIAELQAFLQPLAAEVRPA